MTESKRVFLITGPAGSGKTSLAERISERLGYACISEDEYWVRNNWSGLRTEDQEKAVQEQVLDDLMSAVQDDKNVVLEFILYKKPPNPLTAYTEALSKRYITYAVIVLKPSVEEILDHIEQRARPNDMNNLNQCKSDAENQIRILDDGFIEPEWVIDPTGKTINELSDIVLNCKYV